jgi:hypothetical protein
LGNSGELGEPLVGSALEIGSAMPVTLLSCRYKHDPSKARFGFIVDDNENRSCRRRARQGDLYGYNRMAVAAFESRRGRSRHCRKKSRR